MLCIRLACEGGTMIFGGSSGVRWKSWVWAEPLGTAFTPFSSLWADDESDSDVEEEQTTVRHGDPRAGGESWAPLGAPRGGEAAFWCLP